MVRFECDYSEGALPQILDLMVKTNMEQTPGYGEDVFCEKARELIRRECQAPDADVHFVVGGTQANKVVIQSYLKSYQGVLSAVSGHINVHETGTIEAGGHKVLPLPSTDGKITPRQIKKAVEDQNGDYHCVQPAMVYISNPTEYGTMYTKSELEELRKVCDRLKLPLFLDGARMGYGLASPGNDLTLADYARLCDVFYIGATKVGALFGEAIVICNESMKKDFKYNIKQNCALLAKGRLLGIQFIGLFGEEKLYYKAAQHAVDLAIKLKNAMSELGIKFMYDSPTNQQFPLLPNKVLEQLDGKYSYTVQEKIDRDNTCVRFCTSWATKEEGVDALIADLKKIYNN